MQTSKHLNTIFLVDDICHILNERNFGACLTKQPLENPNDKWLQEKTPHSFDKLDTAVNAGERHDTYHLQKWT